MYLTALTRVTRVGCEIPRLNNPFMKTILTHTSPPLMKLKLHFKKVETESLKFDLAFAVT